MQEGDHYGFTWLDYGIIKYSTSSTQNYCEDSALFDVGEAVDLTANRHGNRDYSLRMTYIRCDEAGVQQERETSEPGQESDSGCGEWT